ncbi:hypothetical protein HWV62_21044 [Athelia sp. TMB]|nr:hypothetical protein HWV62_21044 [Athelia sp. TMB]
MPRVHLELQPHRSTDDANDHDYSNANKHHYDDLEAERMDERADANVMGKLVGKLMLDAYPFADDQTVVLDFACGTGIISRQLVSSTRRIIGVDISDAMVRRYNLRADWQGLAPEEMHAICTDLEHSPEGLDGERFDVIVCASSYHHFDSIESVTNTLASYLKPGGVLLVTDIAQRADNTEVISHPHAHIVAHRRGFSPAEMESVFIAAGLVDVRVNGKAIENVKVHGHDVNIFLAKGVKPSS